MKWMVVEERNAVTSKRRYFVRKGKTYVAGFSGDFTDDGPTPNGKFLFHSIFRSRRKAERKAQELNIEDAWEEQ